MDVDNALVGFQRLEHAFNFIFYFIFYFLRFAFER